MKGKPLDGTKSLGKTVGFVLSFVLAMLVSVLAVLAGTAMTITNTGFHIHLLSETQYARKTVLAIRDEWQTLAGLGGVPADQFNAVVDPDGVKDELDRQVEFYLGGADYRQNRERLTAALRNVIDGYAGATGLEYSPETEQSVSELVDAMADSYFNEAKLPFYDRLFPYLIAFRRYFPVVAGGGIVFSGLSALLLFFAYGKKGATFCAYSFCAAFLLTSVPAIVLALSRFYERIHLLPERFYAYFCAAAIGILRSLALCGFGCLLIGLILIAVAEFSERNGAAAQKR